MILLFDLDNTLLDDQVTKRYYLPMLFKDFNHIIKSDFSTFQDKWISAIPKYYKLYTEGQLSFEEQREKRIKEAFSNNKLTDDDILNILQAYDIHFENSWSLFDGWIDFFNSSDLKRVIVTNGSSHQQKAKIKKLQLDNYFNDIYISGELGFSKPDPQIFQHVCNSLSINPKECIFIGDSWESDIVGSSEFGMRSFWINHTNEHQELGSDNIEVFNNVEDVISRIKEIELQLTMAIKHSPNLPNRFYAPYTNRWCATKWYTSSRWKSYPSN